MSGEEIVAALQATFGTAVVRVPAATPDLVLEVPREMVAQVAAHLKTAPGLEFDYLIFVTAVDRVDYLEVVYGLRSLKHRHQLLMKARVPASEPEIPTVTGIWPAANWDERETYDLFGVRFTGHPNLTRILLPDNWEGHPLRKDYPLTGRPPRVF